MAKEKTLPQKSREWSAANPAPTITLTSNETKQPFKRVDNSKAIRIGSIKRTLAYIFSLTWTNPKTWK